METREQLGVYFLIDAHDLDEAIAARSPDARWGTVALQPMIELDGLSKEGILSLIINELWSSGGGLSMGEPNVPQPLSAPPDSFVEHVRSALAHLSDFSYLLTHPLSQLLVPARSAPNTGQQLRPIMLQAIEMLNPGSEVSFRTPRARLYNLLQLHYIEEQTIQEAAASLSISLRQAYRDLRRAEESVATILWARHTNDQPTPRALQLSSVEAELARMTVSTQPIEISALLERAWNAVLALAQRQEVSVTIVTPAYPIIVSTDPALAQQMLVSILSQAIQRVPRGAIDLTLSETARQPCLTLRYRAADMDAVPVDNTVVQVLSRLGWMIEHTQADDTTAIHIHIPSYDGPTVLVIDDNVGLVELLQRYLAVHACEVVAATSGQEGLRLAQELQPVAILLDVMMPGIDGWEVLQTLRARPQTAAIPVIVCSVFNNPDLAYALGASLFLSKPIRHDAVLSALRQLNIV